ncbi:MAG: S1/P1 Nuclease [Phenylobacterium zucineum]|nr:MAG: S1/P1 Nuclease [Phenylobacterium zucineum]
MKRLAALALAGLTLATPTPLLAWGNTGHRMIGEAAARALTPDTPAFLRAPQAIRDIGELSREPDRSKGSGRLHGTDRDAAHFVDLDEDGKILGGPPMLPLSGTRADYETTLRAHSLDQWKGGYLPYAILDRYQQLTTDFAYWRVLKAAEANPKWAKHRKWFREDRIRREALILKTVGELSHTHFNGWGDYPNPNGYSTAKLHGPFESDLVHDSVKAGDVRAKMTAFKSCGCAIDKRVTDYLVTTGQQVIPFYELEKAGGLAAGDPRGPAFATTRMAIGASELRDVIVESWRASENSKVGWKPVAVKDVVAGTVDPYPALYGID